MRIGSPTDTQVFRLIKDLLVLLKPSLLSLVARGRLTKKPARLDALCLSRLSLLYELTHTGHKWHRLVPDH
jgi:hypothetical protein